MEIVVIGNGPPLRLLQPFIDTHHAGVLFTPTCETRREHSETKFTRSRPLQSPTNTPALALARSASVSPGAASRAPLDGLIEKSVEQRESQETQGGKQ